MVSNLQATKTGRNDKMRNEYKQHNINHINTKTTKNYCFLESTNKTILLPDNILIINDKHSYEQATKQY